MILDILLYSCLISTLLIVWFNTEAFEEYAKLLNFDKPFKIKIYKNKLKKDPTLNYHDYLNTYHSSFFVRLITCPYCVGLWLSVVTALLSLGLLFTGIFYILSLLIYSLTIKNITK
jgi:hypothetical protein